MSGLEDAVADARAAADVSIDPAVHAVKNALEGALAAERAKRHEPADTTGLADPPIREIRIPRDDAPEN
jgi:hypothetical protein